MEETKYHNYLIEFKNQGKVIDINALELFLTEQGCHITRTRVVTKFVEEE